MKQLFFPLLITVASLLPGYAVAVCDQPENDQFDFWLGAWEVTIPNGNVAGYNTIEQDLNNCALREHYTTPTGYEGRSLNIYDAITGQWHQTWVDNTGLLLQLNGGLVDESMVMSGPGVDAAGNALTHRITWTANKNGTVRQHWESRGEGEQWQTLFDGTYISTSR